MVFIFIIFLRIFQANHFGYNTSLLGGRQFSSHYIRTSIPQSNQIPQMQIQRKKLVTQSTIRPKQINYYSHMFKKNEQQDEKPKQNLIIFNNKEKQQNLLTLQKLIEQQQSYQMKQNNPSLNEVLIKNPLKSNQNKQEKKDDNMLELLQQFQQEEQKNNKYEKMKQNEIQQIETQKKYDKDSIEQQILDEQDSSQKIKNEELNLQQQIAQQSKQTSDTTFTLSDIDINKFSNKENTFENKQKEVPLMNISFDQLSNQKQFNQDNQIFSDSPLNNDKNLQQNEISQINQKEEQNLFMSGNRQNLKKELENQQKQKENPFENSQINFPQKPQEFDINEFQQTRDFSDRDSSNNQKENTFKLSKDPPKQQQNQQQFQPEFQSNQNGQQNKFQPEPKKPEQKSIDEKPNLFSMLSFEELMELRGISQDNVKSDESVSFVSIESIGNNKLDDKTQKKGINSFYGPSAEPEKKQISPQMKSQQQKPTRQFKPPVFITEETQNQSQKEYVPSNRPDDPFAGFNQQQEPQQKPLQKQESTFDPFAEFNKQQQEQQQPKKQSQNSGNPFDEFNSGVQDERFSLKSQSMNKFSSENSKKKSNNGADENPFLQLNFINGKSKL